MDGIDEKKMKAFFSDMRKEFRKSFRAVSGNKNPAGGKKLSRKRIIKKWEKAHPFSAIVKEIKKDAIIC